VRDELEKLEVIISNLHHPPPSDQHISKWRKTIQSESIRIKKTFVREAFSLRKEKLVELYIQYHQSAIVQLIDQLIELYGPDEFEEVHKSKLTENNLQLSRFFYLHLEELLRYIEKHFSKYFNQNAKSPESYRFVVHRELKEKLPEIRYSLERKAINKRLLIIVLNPLDSFIEEIHREEISYKKIIFLRELLHELGELTKSTLTGERLDFKLCLSLGYLNYNTHKFYKYCVKEITRLVQEQDTLTKQIEKLAFMIKLINQVQTKPGFIYNEKLRSIKDQLSDWLAEEIYFFEKRQQLAINFPLNPDEPVQKNFKLKVNLTVAQLACLLRSLKEVNIIQNQNMLEVIRFIAGITQTKHTENISWDSLRSKYYNINENDQKTIKDLALKLFNYTRKN
jgi:hypothetical protein